MFRLFKKKQVIDYNKVDTIINKIHNCNNEYSYELEFVDGNEDIFRSKIGGLPYWDTSIEYPKDENGNLLYLAIQINFEEINSDKLPKEGMLQLFISSCENDDFYGISDTLNDQKNWRLVYHKNIKHDINLKNIKELPTNIDFDEDEFPIYGEHFIKFNLIKNSYSKKYRCLDDEIIDIIKNEFNVNIKDISDYFNKEEYSYLYNKLHSVKGYYSLCKLFGFPDFVDSNFLDSEYNKYDSLLFQLGSNDYMNWGGDLGTLYILINKNNLESLNFEDIIFVIDN